MTTATALRNSPSAAYVNEENGLTDAAAYYADRAGRVEYMTLKELAARRGRITRVRLLTERQGGRRMADISYIHGVLPDGTPVSLHATYPMCFDYRNTVGELIEWAKQEGVFAKALGLLDRANWSILF